MPRTDRRRSRAALAAAVVLLAPLAARADERSDARRHFRAGMELISRRRFTEGIVELEAAYAILPNPNVLFNIARAYYDQGELERSADYLRRYLQNDVPDRADVEAVLRRIETRLRQSPGAAPAAPAPTPPRPAATPALPSTPLPPVSTGDAASLRQAAQVLLQLADQVQQSGGTAGAGAPPNSGATPPNSGAVPPNSGADRAVVTGARGSGGVGVTPAGARGRGGEGLGAGRTEDEYEERVVTASRVSQSPLDAPNATGIITAQDIRLSGLTNPLDLLRRLVGVDVMNLETSDTQVSIRGFGQRLNNRVLILIDGRSVYLDFLGATLTPTIFPAVEEIERIEVIRGPGSALYGADAFSGVVNIITRTPGQGRTQVVAGAGSGGSWTRGSPWLRGAFLTSGRQGELAWRGSVQFEQRPAYDRAVDDGDLTYYNAAPTGDVAMRMPRVMLDLQRRFGRSVVLRAGLGAAAGATHFLAPGLLRRYWSDSVLVQPFVQLEAYGFTGRVFWNRLGGSAGPVIVPIGGQDTRARFQQDVVDVDLQYALRSTWGIVQNTLQLGAGYRLKHISWNYLDADHTLNFFSLLAQDTIRLGWRFSGVVSARVDFHPVLATPVFSPRVAATFRPTERRAIRASFGTAFRTPTLLELYLNLNVPTQTPGVSVAGLGSEVYLGGANRLRPESAISVDVGFQDQTFDRFNYEVNLFWTRGTDLINLAPVNLDPLPGMPQDGRAIIVGSRSYANDPFATYVYGAEVAARVSPVDGLDIYANYTLALTEHDPNAQLAGTGGQAPDQRTPRHKVNAGVQLRTRFGLDFETFFHFVSGQVWIEPVFDPVLGSRAVSMVLPDYFVLNARAGYRLFGDRLDLGVVGSNLIDVDPAAGHREHPLGARMGLRVFGTAAFRF